MKVNIHPLLQKMQENNFTLLQQHNPNVELELVIDKRGSGDHGIKTLLERVTHVAPIRQALIDDHLKDYHDYVFMMDSDITYYNLNIIQELYEDAGNDIIAPMVLLNIRVPFFYDTAGFVEMNGKHVSNHSPFFSLRSFEKKREMLSVGAFYIIPSKVFREGAKYAVPENARWTEHNHLCQSARALGHKVYCREDLTVLHADLNQFGEKYH